MSYPTGNSVTPNTRPAPLSSQNYWKACELPARHPSAWPCCYPSRASLKMLRWRSVTVYLLLTTTPLQPAANHNCRCMTAVRHLKMRLPPTTRRSLMARNSSSDHCARKPCMHWPASHNWPHRYWRLTRLKTLPCTNLPCTSLALHLKTRPVKSHASPGTKDSPAPSPCCRARNGENACMRPLPANGNNWVVKYWKQNAMTTPVQITASSLAVY